jgi:hypothetical protein
MGVPKPTSDVRDMEVSFEPERHLNGEMRLSLKTNVGAAIRIHPSEALH